MENELQFDEATHTYRYAGAILPSVTQILKAVLPVSYFGATDWHMERGHAVHACAALECQGIQYEHDPQIDGQVQAIRSWLAARKPRIIAVERRVMHTGAFPYAGTLDLLCGLTKGVALIDWKGSASPWDQWQLGGYADALACEGIEVKHGLVIQLNENGTYKEGGWINLRRARNEWRSILNVYAMMMREGIEVRK